MKARKMVALLGGLWLAGCNAVAAQAAVLPQEAANKLKERPGAIAPMQDGGKGRPSAIESAAFLRAMLDYARVPLESSAMLEVENVPQLPELPNGCEITSATAVLRYLGFDVDKLTMADDYLPCQTPYNQADPNVAFMGNPHEIPAYYCLPGPVVQAVNTYLADAGNTEFTAVDISGATEQDLQWYLTKGTPVLVWSTRYFGQPQYSQTFRLPDGKEPFSNLHCLVLTGFDAENFYFADPMEEIAEVDRVTFLERYMQIGEHAVVITKE